MADSKRTLKVRPAHAHVADPVGLAANINRCLKMDCDSVLPDDATTRKWLRKGVLLPADDATRALKRKLCPDDPPAAPRSPSAKTSTKKGDD